MDPRSQRWQVPPDAALRWRLWEDEHVVYHGASGDTHLLNPAAAEILRRMESTPASVEDVARILGDASLPHATSLLDRFAELGLIVPVDATR